MSEIQQLLHLMLIQIIQLMQKLLVEMLILNQMEDDEYIMWDSSHLFLNATQNLL